MKSAVQRYQSEIAGCPRSPEWKAGALAGMCKADRQPYESCPFKNGTAQADAWAAGFQSGHANQRAYQAEQAQGAAA